MRSLMECNNNKGVWHCRNQMKNRRCEEFTRRYRDPRMVSESAVVVVVVVVFKKNKKIKNMLRIIS